VKMDDGIGSRHVHDRDPAPGLRTEENEGNYLTLWFYRFSEGARQHGLLLGVV